jgi:hypothetical protein
VWKGDGEMTKLNQAGACGGNVGGELSRRIFSFVHG